MPRIFPRLILLVMCLVVLSPTLLLAQVAGGTITGTITDPSGSVIRQGAHRHCESGDAGGPHGHYQPRRHLHRAEPSPRRVFRAGIGRGFAPKATSLTLTVGDELNLSLTLDVGASRSEGRNRRHPAIHRTLLVRGRSCRSGPVIRDLPLNGRSWTDLATLQPGVAAISTQQGFDQGASRGNRGFGAQISIDGGRPSQNSYRLDGISINDYANSGPGSVIGINLGVDAIGEFSVVTSNYAAEYGKTSGGVINAVTRSGTNQYHGTAYSFFRNSAMDASNFFDGATPPPFSRYQYGGSAGGPIWKDRTFFFADFEAIKQNLSNSAQANVLSNAARARVTDPAVLKYIGLYPSPIRTRARLAISRSTTSSTRSW